MLLRIHNKNQMEFAWTKKFGQVPKSCTQWCVKSIFFSLVSNVLVFGSYLDFTIFVTIAIWATKWNATNTHPCLGKTFPRSTRVPKFCNCAPSHHIITEIDRQSGFFSHCWIVLRHSKLISIPNYWVTP